MSSSEFTYEYWVGTQFLSSTMVWNFITNTPKPGWREISRIPASHLQFKPRCDGYAVMVENEEGKKAWLHID